MDFIYIDLIFLKLNTSFNYVLLWKHLRIAEALLRILS